MKNAISYFYNLIPDNIHQTKEEYFFEVNNKKYILQECTRTLDEIYEIYDLEFFLYQRNIYLHQMILNSNNELITKINNKNYILMQVFNDENRKITLEDIKKLSNVRIANNYIHIKRNNWHELWTKKIDYIEYQIDQNKYKYKDFSSNMDYFIGLTENAIQLLTKKNNERLYISHQRINTVMRVKELYNPLNIVLDSRTRDISEYFKDLLFKKNDIEEEIFNYLKSSNLDKEELELFFIRFLYLTRYFDLFDKVLLNIYNENIEQEIVVIQNTIDKYELVLKKIYLVLYYQNILPEIEWLKKASN